MWFGVSLLLVLGVVAGAFFWIYPKIEPAPDIQIEKTSARLERGKYLVNHVTVCMFCHGDRYWNYYSAPNIAGTEGKGGQLFNRVMGFQGDLYIPNITPYVLQEWSDGELVRAIVSGIHKEGQALSPFMPYTIYQHLAEEDLYAIVAYIRTLKPIEYQVPPSEIDWWVNLLVRMVPEPYQAKTLPKKGSIAYGKYLANIGGCADCHTNLQEKGPEFAGGQKIILPDGSVNVTPPLLPDDEGKIARMTVEQFVQRFQSFANPARKKQKVEGSQTIMPWTMYAHLEEQDLKAIYQYLQTL
ncbi:MAG: cytochrome C [Candidatus Parabeggiatoa sp. nov. 1]|nr:MAG: cytochrome C [Gammaproteobacteria bacterium]